MPNKDKLNLEECLSELPPDVSARVKESMKRPMEDELCRLAEEWDFTKNHVSNLQEFIKRWHEGKKISDTISKGFLKSDLGNINIDKSPTCSKANIFTKWHPRFEDSIEVGVRELVLRLIQKLDCITYSSCQGHVVADNHTSFTVRHVGIVPRNSFECNYLLQILQQIGESTNNNMRRKLVRVIVKKNIITSEDADMSCIDILFVPVVYDQKICSLYFKDLEFVYNEFLTQLRLV